MTINNDEVTSSAERTTTHYVSCASLSAVTLQTYFFDTIFNTAFSSTSHSSSSTNTTTQGYSSPSSYDLSNNNIPSSNNDSDSETVVGTLIYVSNYVTTFDDIGNNLLSMSSNESNNDATPAVMVEPYNVTYDTTIPVTYEALSYVWKTTTSNEISSAIIMMTTVFYGTISATVLFLGRYSQCLREWWDQTLLLVDMYVESPSC